MTLKIIRKIKSRSVMVVSLSSLLMVSYAAYSAPDLRRELREGDVRFSSKIYKTTHLEKKDIDKKEFQDFIESMTQDQFSKIRAYIESIPKLTHEVKFNCVKCNENNNLTVEGLQSFL